MSNAQLLEAMKALLAQSQQTGAPSASVPTPKAKVAKATKAQPKVAKPTTRREAVAVWKEERNINADTKAAYDLLYASNWASDWAKWVAKANAKGLKGSARKEANRAEAARIRNVYRKLAGMSPKTFE